MINILGMVELSRHPICELVVIISIANTFQQHHMLGSNNDSTMELLAKNDWITSVFD